MYNQIFFHQQTQTHLEAIVENLEESLVTINQGRIEFINSKFKATFQGLGFDMG